jgi:hypothetical protein
MSMNALALPPSSTVTLRVLDGGVRRNREPAWYEKRAMIREIVGGCPDHW